MAMCGCFQGAVIGGSKAIPDDQYQLFAEQPRGRPALAKALREGWMLKKSSHDGRLCRVLRFPGTRRVYVRLTADAVAFYQDEPGSASGRGRRPTEIIFLSSISAVLGQSDGSEHLQLIHARGFWWELRPEHPEPVADWAKAIVGRLQHFRQAARQSQRVTASTIAYLNDPSYSRRRRQVQISRWIHKWLPCWEPCANSFRDPASRAFALSWRLRSAIQKPEHREPEPYRGPREGISTLADYARVTEVSDPDLQEAQGAHWSEQAVRFLQACQKIPENLAADFALTLRMGAPDGLKRVVWPLAAGEAVIPPQIQGRLGVASSTCRNPAALYACLCQRAFGGVRPDRLQDPVPTFCQGIQGRDDAPPLRAVVKHLSLMTPEGEEALRRLLWCVQLTCHVVEFCPFLPNLLAALLVFFDEAEAMMMITCILHEAENEPSLEKRIRPRIILNRVQINKEAKLFVREGEKDRRIQSVLLHLDKLGVNKHEVAVKLLQDGMAHCLPFRAFCRVVGSFLAEGSNVLLRYALALLKLRGERVLESSTAEEASKQLDKLGEGFSSPSEVDTLSKAAFSFQSLDVSFARVSSLYGSKYVAPKMANHIFCRPRLFSPRGHCPDELWEFLWSCVPSSCRIFDPRLVYTPAAHGTSMRTCLENCSKHHEAPMVFFVYTPEGDIIGGFSPSIWLRTSGYVNLVDIRRSVEDSFVFRRLHDHQPEHFAWTGANPFLMQASELHGLVFGGNGAAIAISHDMVWATTRASATFQSPMLVETRTATPRREGHAELHSDFKMMSFEVFALL